MEEQFFYHVISDIPKKVGEHVILDDKHPNGVYKRVYEEMETVKDIYEHPGKYKNEELTHKVDVALRELALEKVRKEMYPEYPSRMASLYVSKTFEEAELWGDYFAKLGRPTYGIAKIKVSGRVFEGDAYKCFDGVIDEKENLRQAEIYWKNEANEDGCEPIVEILADGDIEIVETLKVINANTEYDYFDLREKPECKDMAADWFHKKWGVPKEAYLECMTAYLEKKTEYGWYLSMHGDQIIGGLGVIENDFHDRKDLSPNVCAVYTEEAHREQGIAGKLLNLVVEDMRKKGVSPLYLVTDHTGFYERYGWEFYCMAQGDGEPDQTRLYIHK